MFVIYLVLVAVGAVLFAVGYLGQITTDFSKKNQKKA